MMQLKNSKLDYRGQDIYIGIDVHLRSWSVTILTECFEHKTYTMTPNADGLSKYLHKYFPGGKYLCVYEAGFSGFWLQRQLTLAGISCIVVNAADVPQRDKDKKNKTDTVDSRKLAKSLRSKQIDSIYIPSEEDIDNRTLLRTRHLFVQNQTRSKNRIKSLLYYNGIEVRPATIQSYWSEKYIKQLETIEDIKPSTKESLLHLIRDLKHNKAILKDIDIKIKLLSQDHRFKQRVELLRTIPGIGLLTAMIILTELIDINRFRRDDDLCSFAGLIPTEHSSGPKVIKGDITPRRNKMLRHVIVESAWIAVRKDPALLQSYTDFLQRGIKKNVAIVKIAKKLLCRVAHVLRKNESYSLAVVS